MPPHKSKSNSISFVEGQQNGAGVAPPLRLLQHGRAGLCLVLLWSLRGLCGGRFPANVPPPPQRPSEAKAWPHPSALPPLALGKPASRAPSTGLRPASPAGSRRDGQGEAMLIRSATPVWFVFVAWSLRGIVHSRSAFCLSRQRHGAGMNQVRLHRHATAAVCGSCAPTKKPCRTKPPAPAFSLPHTTLSQSQAWSLRVLFIVPARLACQAARGALRCSFPAHPAMLPVRPKWLPKFATPRYCETDSCPRRYRPASPQSSAAAAALCSAICRHAHHAGWSAADRCASAFPLA